MQSFKKYSICWRTASLLCSFPELFLSRISVHRTYFEKAVCKRKKSCLKEENKEKNLINCINNTSEFLRGVWQVPRFRTHNTPVINQAETQLKSILTGDNYGMNWNCNKVLTLKCWENLTHFLLHRETQCPPYGGN